MENPHEASARPVIREMTVKACMERRGEPLQPQLLFAPPLHGEQDGNEALVDGLEIPVEFAMLGASNPVMMQGRLPEQRAQIIAALDRVIDEIGEDRLRHYRTNLKHL